MYPFAGGSDPPEDYPRSLSPGIPLSESLVRGFDGLSLSSPRIETPRFGSDNMLSYPNYLVDGQSDHRDPWLYGGYERASSVSSNLRTWTDRVDDRSALYPRTHEYGSYPQLSGTSIVSEWTSQSNIYPASSFPRLSRPNTMDLANSPLSRQSAWCGDVFGEYGDAYLHSNITGYHREVVTQNLNDRRPTGINMSPLGSSIALRDARLQDLRGSMRNLAKSHSGHKILLKKMKAMTAEEIKIVLGDLVQHMGELMVDPFANTVIQKLIDSCSDMQRAGILVTIIGGPQLIRICLDHYGSRIIWNLLRNLTLNWPKQEFLLAIYPGIVQLSKNSNGHKVIEQCLKVFPARYNKILSEPLADNFYEIATDQHGCRVLSEHIKIVEGEWEDLVVNATVAYAVHLALHRYGNYVVQDLLNLQLPGKLLNNVHRQFTGIYPALSRNKFASNVVEKCLHVVNGRDFTQIVCELLDDDFPLLLSDEYANFVVQTMTVLSKALRMHIHDVLVDRIRASRPLIESSIYGKKALDNLKNKHNIHT